MYVINMLYNFIFLVVNVEVAKSLKEPENLMELKTYVSYMKDKSGISGWKEKQELVEVREAF